MSDSLITKKAIAEGMKEILKIKTFDKVTVSDITKHCGLNRQTFYYHFQDKFDLVDWIYYNDLIAVVVKDLTFENWDEKIMQMLITIKNNDYFYENTLKASVEDEFRLYLFRVTSELFFDIISSVIPNMKLENKELRFIADFYAYGIIGIIISWVQRGMKETPQYIALQLKNLAYGTEKFAMNRFMEKNQEL